MLRKVKIGTSVLAILASVAIGAVTVCGVIAYDIASHILEEESFNKLTAVREMKGKQVEDYFEQIRDQVLTFSENRMIVRAMRNFRQDFRQLEEELGGGPADRDQRLRAYYRDTFLPQLRHNLELPGPLEDFWPQRPASRLLQYLYIAANPHAADQKHLLDSAEDISSYSRNHAIYHPLIRNYLERFGYHDIFLVDADTGDIAYSVFKEVELGTSLQLGPYRHTHLATAFRAARDATEPDFVRLVDFAPYAPSYYAQASFIASPIFDAGEKIGILIFQMPVDRINNLMTNHQAWSKVGLGRSGETYIVGNDYTLRNQSRFLIEDRDNYLRAIRAAGLPEATVTRINNLNSSIGLQEARTAGTEAALAGQTGTAIFPDYRGVPVLSSYRPLQIPDMQWVIMSEIDESEAFQRIDSLRHRIIFWLLILIGAIVLIAVAFTRRLTRPLWELAATADKLARGKLDVIIDTRGRDEISALASSFAVMRDGLKRLIAELEEMNQELEQKVEARTVGVERANEQMQMIVKFAPDAIIGMDRERRILLLNTAAERLFGYRTNEVVGQSLDMLIAEKYRTSYHRRLKEFDRSDTVATPLTAGIEGLRKDGATFPAATSVLKVTAQGEKTFTLFCRDISERRQLEQMLKRAFEAAKKPQ